MTISAPELARALHDLEIPVRSRRVVVLGGSGYRFEGAESVFCIERFCNADEIDGELRADLGIVVDGLQSMPREEAVNLLARLRDIHCRRVLIALCGNDWTAEELLALGYLQTDCASPDGRLYLYDPDLFNQPREWNNPGDWANPENFRKFRW